MGKYIRITNNVELLVVDFMLFNKPKFKIGDKVKVNGLGREKMNYVYGDKMIIQDFGGRDGIVTEIVLTCWTPKDCPWIKKKIYYITDGKHGDGGTWEDYLELDGDGD